MTACAWIMLAASLPCRPGVEVNETLQHYAIEGSNATDLAREMHRRGPEHRTGQVAWGLTRWTLRARYDLEMDPAGQCRLLSPVVVLDLRIDLPRWQPALARDGALSMAWDRAYRAMVSHELEHRRHAHDAAGQLADALSALPAVDGPCNGLEASVKRQVRLAADAASRQSRDYDLATDFGALNRIHP